MFDTDLLLGVGRFQTLDPLGAPYIETVGINRASTSVSSMTNDDLHTLRRYEEKVGKEV